MTRYVTFPAPDTVELGSLLPRVIVNKDDETAQLWIRKLGTGGWLVGYFGTSDDSRWLGKAANNLAEAMTDILIELEDLK